MSAASNFSYKSAFHKQFRQTYTTLIQWATMLLLTLPQSRPLLLLADAIFAFFLLTLSFSPILTIAVSSFLHSGQYLEEKRENNIVSTYYREHISDTFCHKSLQKISNKIPLKKHPYLFKSFWQIYGMSLLKCNMAYWQVIHYLFI